MSFLSLWFDVYQIFEDGINEPAADHGLVSKWAMNRNYLVSPINGILKYHRLGKQERTDPEVPFEKSSLVLSDVSLTITEVLNVVSLKLFLLSFMRDKNGVKFLLLWYFLGTHPESIFYVLFFAQAQYHDWIKLLEVVSRYKTYVEVSHLRPMVPVLEGPNLWWRYAAQAGLQQKKLW